MGASGPQGPQGPQGPRGEPAVADPNVVAQTLSTQTQFLNSLAKTIASDTNVGSIQNNVVTKILQSPILSNTIAQNQVFQNIVGQSLINESSALGSKIADGIIADPANTLQLASSIVSQGSFLNDLSQTLSDPNLPYAEYIRGPPGSIANIKTAIQPISLLCDTVGNCKTPQFGSYLNFTNGNLLLNNNKGIPAFRVAGDGGPWITGNSGGQLGTYNDNTNTGTVAIKWDAQGNVIVGDITQTTGSLKVGGNGYLNNLYATGELNANNVVNINSTDGSSLAQFNMHLGGQSSDIGGTGNDDGSTFTITKNGPYRGTLGDGSKNAVLFNNYNNPMVFGDMRTTGNIFMLNNNENIAQIPNGNNWYNSFTGMNTSGNNSAIINNTGTMGGLAGSLMLVGNASADKVTGTRVVSVFDRLQIGNWQIYEDNNGELQFTDVRGNNKTRKIRLPYIKSSGFYSSNQILSTVQTENSYKLGGKEDIDWIYTNNENDSRCMTNWTYYDGNGNAIEKNIGTTTLKNSSKPWCALKKASGATIQQETNLPIINSDGTIDTSSIRSDLYHARGRDTVINSNGAINASAIYSYGNINTDRSVIANGEIRGGYLTSNGDIRGRGHLRMHGQLFAGGYMAIGGNAHWHDGPGAGAARDW